MQKQSVALYIFPHFGLKAQPVIKEEVYTSSFFVFPIPWKVKETAGFIFYFDGRTLFSSIFVFLPKSVQNTPNIYFFEGLNSPNNALQEITMFLLFPQALLGPPSSFGSLCIRGNYIDTNIFLVISIRCAFLKIFGNGFWFYTGDPVGGSKWQTFKKSYNFYCRNFWLWLMEKIVRICRRKDWIIRE